MDECCGPKTLVKFFHAVADHHRQNILSMIKGHKNINASNIEEKIKLSQPTISHHLAILKEAKLITAKKKGRETYYSLNQKIISSHCLALIKKLSK